MYRERKKEEEMNHEQYAYTAEYTTADDTGRLWLGAYRKIHFINTLFKHMNIVISCYTTTMKAIFQNYAAKLFAFAFTIMAVIGLLMYHGEACQRHQQINSQKKACSSFCFRREEAGTEQAPSENDKSQSSRRAGFVLRNWQVTDGGWGAAISCMAVGAEWAPDQPPAKLD